MPLWGPLILPQPELSKRWQENESAPLELEVEHAS